MQQSVREAIEAGRLTPGSALPSEKALESEHGVSRITVRRALEELEREGLIERGRGRQARVVPLLTAAVSTRIEDDLASILQLGRGTQAEVLSYAWRMPTPAVLAALATPAEEPVLRVERLRRWRSRPVLHTLAHVPAAIGALLPRDALANSTMLDLLATRGVQAGGAEQEMYAAPCDASISPVIGLPPGAPVFVLNRLVKDVAGRPIQHIVATFRWDSFTYRLATTRRAVGGMLDIEAAGQID